MLSVEMCVHDIFLNFYKVVHLTASFREKIKHELTCNSSLRQWKLKNRTPSDNFI